MDAPFQFRTAEFFFLRPKKSKPHAMPDLYYNRTIFLRLQLYPLALTIPYSSTKVENISTLV
jgi:hypothetical protein